MQMISFVFLAFCAVLYVILLVISKLCRDAGKACKASNVTLLLASYAFICYADVRFGLILLLLSLITWFCARKRLTAVGVIAALAMLAYFKYTNFFISSFASLFGQDWTLLKLILPLGISFYTFSAISYLADVHRQKLEARPLLDVALYLSFFPKLTSGPVQTSADFFAQTDKHRPLTWNNFSAGMQIFVFGLFKKIVLADRLSVFVNQAFEIPMAFSGVSLLLAAIAYSLQIYFDFSGYSDMAIGVSKVFGIHLPRNFNLPYLAHNVTELWKRWHITLSSWLQNYLYISLGGSRKGTYRTYVNLVLTMVLGGIWHGANWTYIVWGLLHGVALAVHKVWMQKTHSPDRKPSLVGSVLSIAVTYLFTTFCWIFFRAESLSQAWLIISRIVTFQPGIFQPYFWLIVGGVVLLVSVCIAAFRSRKNPTTPRKQNVCRIEGIYPILDLSKLTHLTLFFVICGLLLALAYTGGSPFIYGNY